MSPAAATYGSPSAALAGRAGLPSASTQYGVDPWAVSRQVNPGAPTLPPILTPQQQAQYGRTSQPIQEAVPVSGPSFHQDPNTGNVSSWDPTRGVWMPSSTGEEGFQQKFANQKQLDDLAMDEFGNFSAKYGAGAPGAPAHVGSTPDTDSSAAEAQAFAREKDRLGQVGRGALDSLNESLAGQNLTGSSTAANRIGDLTQGTEESLGNVVRDQAQASLDRARQVADRNYGGNITQRSQDMNYAIQRANQLQSLFALFRRAGTAY